MSSQSNFNVHFLSLRNQLHQEDLIKYLNFVFFSQNFSSLQNKWRQEDSPKKNLKPPRQEKKAL